LVLLLTPTDEGVEGCIWKTTTYQKEKKSGERSVCYKRKLEPFLAISTATGESRREMILHPMHTRVVEDSEGQGGKERKMLFPQLTNFVEYFWHSLEKKIRGEGENVELLGVFRTRRHSMRR
jgi:hypothetical protein